MPGEKSLAEKQYYAHKYNSFWFILTRILRFEQELSYQNKKKLLLKNGIAVWDVLQYCSRKGSLDASIVSKTVIVNDFVCFFESHPSIKIVYFNGKKAENLYRKHVMPLLPSTLTLQYVSLPSTSPAMAMLTKEQKYNQWLVIQK